MTANLDGLSTLLEEGDLKLIPFADSYTEDLRAACNADAEIWEIYPLSMYGEKFDVGIDYFKTQYAKRSYIGFLVSYGGEIVGMSHYINADTANRTLEIGGTYITPAVRGTGLNGMMKRLMINHAFGLGYRKITFRVDARNARSRAAVLKLGAKHEGILRKDRVTWTGYIRDTMIFGLLSEEWSG